MIRFFSFSLTLSFLFFVQVFAEETLIPWSVSEASRRQVFEIRAITPVKSALIQLPLCGNAVLEQTDDPICFVDATDPLKLLPYFKDDDSYFIVLDKGLTGVEPIHLVACQGKNVSASLRLEKKPEILNDYATTQLGKSWDFENGDCSTIQSWGVNPNHYGKPTVEGGWLKIPILGDDVYFIYGLMWGDAEHSANLDIDSSKYRFLELRIRQSCDEADWRFYVTDKTGAYRMIEFRVKGKDAKVFRFDLKEMLPDFWDGREFRALRIDPIKKKPNSLAEVDYVRIFPDPPTVLAGPVFSKDSFEARDNAKNIEVVSSPSTVAGQETPLSITIRDKRNAVIAGKSFTWVAALNSKKSMGESVSGKDGVLNAVLPVIEKVGSSEWTVGLADDLGQPILSVSKTIRIEPDVLAGYCLSGPEFVDAESNEAVPIKIVGIDRFRNTLPINISKPRWSIDNGGAVLSPNTILRGNTASVSIKHSNGPLTKHRITLTDENGKSGSIALTTVGYRKNRIRTNENGYMVTPDGKLYFPIGGLYANWPHGKPNENGSLNRSLDLFPCDNIPYLHDFPWPEDVEKKVVDYLDHCKSHGLNSLRLMLRNMDIVGRVDPIQIKAVLHYFDLARQRDITFNVVLFEDYQKPPYVNDQILEKLVLPHYTKEELDQLPPHRARFLIERKLIRSTESRYFDPDVVACHKDYLRELIPILAGREEIISYEFENEMYVQPIVWCREISDFIRTIDPHTLILANPHHMFWPKPIIWRDCGADLIAFHPYNNGRPSADMGSVFHVETKWTSQLKIPFNTGEGGVYDGQISYEKDCLEQRIQGARDQAWMAICGGANGFMYWTVMHEKIIAEFGKITPALNAVGIDLKDMKRGRADVAIVMPTKVKEDLAWSDRNSDENNRCTDLCKRFLELGIDFDTPPKGEDGDYLHRFDVLTTEIDGIVLSDLLRPTVARPAPGWDLATLCSENNETALLYLRNLVGGIEDFGIEKRPCYCRVSKEGKAMIRLEKPEQWKKIIVYDLDTGRSTELRSDQKGTVRLGETKSDFVIGLHAE